MEALIQVIELSEEALISGVATLRQKRVFEANEGSSEIIRFVHTRIQEASYARISPARRVALHRKLAELMTAKKIGTTPALLAHHWDAAEEQEKAANLYLKAASQAAQHYALPEAEQLFKRALFLIRSDTALARRAHLDLVEMVLLPLNRVQDGLVVLRQLHKNARLDGIPELQARTLLLLAKLLLKSGDHEDALRFQHSALEQFQGLHDIKGQGESLLNLGTLYASQGQLHHALRLHSRAAELFKSHGAPELSINAEVLVADTLHKLGRAEEAFEMLQQALKTARQHSNPALAGDALNHLASIYLEQGEREEATQCLREVIDLHKTQSNHDAESSAIITLAEVLFLRGRLREAREHCHYALTIITRNLNNRHLGRALLLKALLDIELKAFQQATETLAKALSHFRNDANHKLEFKAMNLLAKLFFEQQNFAEAEQVLDHVFRWTDNTDHLEKGATLMLKSKLHCSRGLIEDAHRPLSEAISIGSNLNDDQLVFDARLDRARLFRYQGQHQLAEGLLVVLKPLVLTQCSKLSALNFYIEDCHLALAQQQGVRARLRVARAWFETMDIGRDSLGGSALNNLERAAIMLQCNDAIIAGECPGVLTPALLARLEGHPE